MESRNRSSPIGAAACMAFGSSGIGNSNAMISHFWKGRMAGQASTALSGTMGGRPLTVSDANLLRIANDQDDPDRLRHWTPRDSLRPAPTLRAAKARRAK